MSLVTLMQPKKGETQVARWQRLRTLANSRWHLPDSGPCYAAMGKPGCPTCEAHAALTADVDKMLDLILTLKV